MQTMLMDKAQYKIARFDGVARVARAGLRNDTAKIPLSIRLP